MSRCRICPWVILIVALVSNLYFYLGMTGQQSAAMYQENNLLENAQLLLLVLCLFGFVAQVRAGRENGGRLIMFASVLLSFTFFIREIDLRPFGFPQAITWVTDGPGRDMLIILLWTMMITVIGFHYRAFMAVFRRFVFSRAGSLFWVCAVFLFFGVLLDKGIIRYIPTRFYEELLEFNGYVFLLLAALASKSALHHASSKAG